MLISFYITIRQKYLCDGLHMGAYLRGGMKNHHISVPRIVFDTSEHNLNNCGGKYEKKVFNFYISDFHNGCWCSQCTGHQ